MIGPGTKIICPECELHIATAIEPIDLDEVFIDQFEWNVEDVEDKIKTVCPECGEHWGDAGGYLHTDRGWKS